MSAKRKREPAFVVPPSGGSFAAARFRLKAGLRTASGVFAAAFASASLGAATPVPEPLVELPPMIVSETVDPLKWRYLEAPGLEIIAVCSDEATEALVQRHLRLQELLPLLLPRSLQPGSSVRETYIFFNEQIGRIAGQEVVADIAGVNDTGNRRVRFTPNMRMSDVDAHAVFVVVREQWMRPGSEDGLYFARQRVAALLHARAPALPAWFIAGTLGLYDLADFGDEAVAIKRAQWISDDENAALRRDPDRPRVLLPMSELLARPMPTADQEADELTRIWRAQCALFVRWAIADQTDARKEALWRFAERSAQEPPTEALFRECFGLGFADARDRLSDHLPAALGENLELKPAKLSRPPRLQPRPATRAEVARIRGDWERMQIRYVRARYPALAPKYVDQALRTLRRAHAAGDRDPELVAVLGLAELDAGNAKEAEEFLRAATQSAVARPRVWFELARLRFTRARETAAPNGGRVSAAESTEVLRLLEQARALQPPLAAVYGLMAEVWRHSAVAPGRADLARLEEGARLFPRNSALVMTAVHLHAQARLIEPAATLISLGQRHAPDAASRDKFATLAQALAARRGK